VFICRSYDQKNKVAVFWNTCVLFIPLDNALLSHCSTAYVILHCLDKILFEMHDTDSQTV